MYLTPKKAVVIDIETDDLDATIVWCMCAKDLHTGESWTFTEYNDIRKFFDDRPDYMVIGHNALKFDVPVLNRLVGTRIGVSRVIDTLLLSMVYSPSLAGGHSLEAWGERIKFPKIDFKDFSARTLEMLEYCMGDVELCLRVFRKLSERMLSVGFSERGIEIEHHAWWIIEKQRKNGFKFNQVEASILYAKLTGILQELEKEIYHAWPPTLQPVKKYKQAFRKDGSHTTAYAQHVATFPRLELSEDGSYTAYDYVAFDLASPNQRLDKLLETGWEPREPTKSGNSWKVTEKGELVPSLQEFLEKTPHEGAKKLAMWVGINSKATMINTWLEAYNEETGCIHGTLWLANTFRYRHSNPNSANIPRISVRDGRPVLGIDGRFSYECRDLWTTRDANTRSLVGVDAKGIQFRILAHYLNDKEFTDVVLGGDIHEYNRSKTGLGTRDQNKTFGYAALLGAGAAKTGTIFGVGPRQGGQIKDKWIKTVPGLKELYARLESELAKTGRITLCDGTRVLVPSPHMVLAYLLQGDESRIMKQAKIYVDQDIRKERLDVLWCGDIHDEWQADVLNTAIEAYCRSCEQRFGDAGRSFDYNLPIECDWKVGKTWAETH